MMSPRNSNNTNCNNTLPSTESDDSQVLDIVPNILHKKHKVIKLVRAQLLKLQEEGLVDYYNSNLSNEGVKFENLDYSADSGFAEKESQMEQKPGNSSVEEIESLDSQTGTTKLVFLWFITFLLSTFLLVFAAAWLSAGPLSNRAPSTPISWSSLVQTDSICELERKYLLRWSTSNFLE